MLYIDLAPSGQWACLRQKRGQYIVNYYQLCNGHPTGNYFSVPRWKYHVLEWARAHRDVPLLGKYIRHWLATTKVEYTLLVSGLSNQTET